MKPNLKAAEIVYEQKAQFFDRDAKFIDGQNLTLDFKVHNIFEQKYVHFDAEPYNITLLAVSYGTDYEITEEDIKRSNEANKTQLDLYTL